jgi:CRISPR-associated Csx2 family protein
MGRSILVTFLGRARKKGDFYEPAEYDFGGGSVFAAAYMGAALLRHLRARKRQVDLVVLLGTRSSMWDALVESLGPGDGFDDERLSLIDRVEQQNVDQACLDSVAGLMSRALGVETRPRLIGFARSEREQVELLFAILAEAGALGPDDEISIDVTHGFRHFPMLGLLAAMYFEVARGSKIGRVYYGAFEMREPDGAVPVIRLDGLLQLGRWIRALHAYGEDGDFGRFAALLKKDGVIRDDGGETLQQLAYFESTAQVGRAQDAAVNFRASAGSNWGGVSALFEDDLLRRLPQPGESTYRGLRALAFQNLGRGDYLRAAIDGFEALEERIASGYTLTKAERQARHDLRNLRNALAHAGDHAHGAARGALPDRRNVEVFLRDRLPLLLPDIDLR